MNGIIVEWLGVIKGFCTNILGLHQKWFIKNFTLLKHVL